MNIRRGFASDNNAGVHPEILNAIGAANVGHTFAYGYDAFTERALVQFEKHFGSDISVHFVFNGTGANTLCLKALTKSFHSILCSDVAHIYEDECGAPEHLTGCKLIPVKAPHGKIVVEQLEPYLKVLGSEHRSQPKVISLTQTTEYGTVYSCQEIKDICAFAHKHKMYVHIDGARLANAAAHLNVSLKALTRDLGVDALSFGGTKNGLMFGEAVIFFEKSLGEEFKFIRKNGTQLISKMRFVAAQFEKLLEGDLWLKNAKHANAMAALLAKKLEQLPHVKLTQKVQANGIFATLSAEHLARLSQKWMFHIWDAEKNEVRWMTSFDTTEDDVNQFVSDISQLV